MEGREKSPLKIGWESAKANAVPMVILWAVAACLIVGYYCVPGVADCFAPLARWQRESGWVAAFLNLFFFCGVIPGVFIWSIRELRPKYPFATLLVQSVWCGAWGVVNNEVYAILCRWFGSGTDLWTLFLKTAVDQFVWTVLVMAPVDAVFFFWLGRDFSLRRVRAEWPRDFVYGVILPNLLSNWIVWIPVLCVIYAFPLPLQIQLAGIVGSIWTLLCLQIGRRSAVREKA